jgi:hypothetical protein
VLVVAGACVVIGVLSRACRDVRSPLHPSEHLAWDLAFPPRPEDMSRWESTFGDFAYFSLTVATTFGSTDVDVVSVPLPGPFLEHHWSGFEPQSGDASLRRAISAVLGLRVMEAGMEVSRAETVHLQRAALSQERLRLGLGRCIWDFDGDENPSGLDLLQEVGLLLRAGCGAEITAGDRAC